MMLNNNVNISYRYPMNDYEKFLASKIFLDKKTGFNVDIKELNPKLFDWQKVIVKWAIGKGRACLFEDCGLGKTPQQLEWGRLVVKKENSPVLILAPLAVAEQTYREGLKFNIDVNICSRMSNIKKGINITNYEKLHKFNLDEFVGIVLDESSILKNFSGSIRNAIIEKTKNIPYRLACTATPAPNDYIELGNHSEFLGIMSRSEMLASFFINDTANTGNWRLKGHVKDNIFWEWLSSWTVMITKPSDIGFEDVGFSLPKIFYHEVIIKSNKGKPKYGFGLLGNAASTLNDRRRVRRETIDIRCKYAADLINKTDDIWVSWCNLNDEGIALKKYIEDSVEVAGRHPEDIKKKRMIGFADGKVKRIITKPKIAGLGMNWQVCSKAAFVGLSDSWEQFYQAVRRIWRFGQSKEVHIYIIIEEREKKVLANIKRKEAQAKDMIIGMMSHMINLTKKEIKSSEREYIDYTTTVKMELPKWIMKS